MWPRVLPLESKHIQNCRLIESREKMLEYLPQNAVCAELGIFLCDFSAKILRTTQPAKLHLVDVDNQAIQIAKKRFCQEMSSGLVEVHHGDSAEIVGLMPDQYFDWVYIDADHSYEAVKRDLTAVRAKLKSDGVIALNDYVFFGTSDFIKYGVIEAVNQFCIEYDFELLYFALEGRMYNDVVIRELK